MSDLVDFVEFVNYARRRHRELGPRRYLRDYSDPFTKYSVREFQSRYRFTPETVKDVLLPLLLSDLRKPTKRGLPFAPEIMLLITLRYFATGSVQKQDGDIMNVCQQSVSRIIAKVSMSIARRMKDFVKFPSVGEINSVKQKFYEIAQFPEVIGCIDCMHVKIKCPGGVTPEIYRNGKGAFSINVQVVIGLNSEFYDLVARWPGSTPDSYIFDNSSVKQRLNSGTLQGVLLGDHAYVGNNTLLTPFVWPNSIPQENYNRSLIKTRFNAKRGLDIWRKRFPCLQMGMGIKLNTVLAVICACATLHNIALLVDDLVPLNWVYMGDDDEVDDVAPMINDYLDNYGFTMRQSLVDRFFTHN